MLNKKKKGNPKTTDASENTSVTDHNIENDTLSASENDQQESIVSQEEKLQKEVEAANDKYLRLFAEFENFKRRTAKERIELINTASKSVLLAMLPVLDDFDRAQKSLGEADDIDALKEGVKLIRDKFNSLITQQGVKEMDVIGQPFDADLHEAVTNIPAPSDELKGKIVDQLEKGYLLNDKVIRFAKVIVGA